MKENKHWRKNNKGDYQGNENEDDRQSDREKKRHKIRDRESKKVSKEGKREKRDNMLSPSPQCLFYLDTQYCISFISAETFNLIVYKRNAEN